MKNKLLFLALIALTTFISGCKSTPTPYEIDRQIDYKPRRASSFYDFGITEEKVNDHIYYITAKLEGTSSLQRAKDMWYLHAANVALRNGYEKFATKKRKSGKWCMGTRNKSTGERSTDDGGPKAAGFVLLVKDKSQLKERSKIYDAKKVQSEYSAKVNAIIDEQMMYTNNERFVQACRDLR